MARLKDKTVLITGASGAVGRAVVEAVNAAGGVAVTSDLAGQGAEHSLDVTSELDWLKTIADIGRTRGRLDGLVNAAGIAALGNIEETDFATWRKIMSVNLDGTFLGCKHGLSLLKVQGGSIVNLSSIAGLIGGHNFAAYNASKGGVRRSSATTAGCPITCAHTPSALTVAVTGGAAGSGRSGRAGGAAPAPSARRWGPTAAAASAAGGRRAGR